MALCRFVNKSKHIWGVQRLRKWAGAPSSELKTCKQEPAFKEREMRSRKTEEGNNKQAVFSWCPGMTHNRS
jgi:hypothetical protein